MYTFVQDLCRVLGDLYKLAGYLSGVIVTCISWLGTSVRRLPTCISLLRTYVGCLRTCISWLGI